MKENVIQFEHVSVQYHHSLKPAVFDISFGVPENSVVCIVGESGSGKSTLIRSAIGLLSDKVHMSGKIYFDGQELQNRTGNQMRELCGSRISMIFQNAGQYMDGRRKIGYQFAETIRCHQRMKKTEAYQMAEDMLGKLCLPDPKHIMESYPFELSGGMRQRVAIAMAMVLKPDLLLADEPTSALDVTIQAQVVRLMMEMREIYDTSILMVTHNLGVASYMADYIAIMKEGSLVEFGTRNQIIESPSREYTKQLLRAVPQFYNGQMPSLNCCI